MNKYVISIVAPEIFPVPPIKGGAVETWIYESINDYDADNYLLNIFSTYQPGIEKNNENKKIRYFYYKKNLIDKIFNLSYKLPTKNSRSFLFNLSYSFWVALKCIKIKPKIIHVHNRWQFIPIIKFFNSKSKIIFHVHQVSALNFSYHKAKRLVKQIDCFLGCSNFIEERIKQKFSFCKNLRTQTIYNGVNTDKFSVISNKDKNELKNKLGLQNKKIILFAGRLAENKGAHLIIQAFLKINRDDIALVIVGGNTYSDFTNTKYIKYLMKLSKPKENNIKFLGYIEHSKIHELFQISDIFVMPSLVEEALGISLIEAMSSGLICVASKNGGIPELITNKSTGFLVEQYNSVDSWRETINQILNTPDDYSKITENAINLVKNNFSWNKISKTLLNLYENILTKKNILFVEFSYGFGGSGVVLFNILKVINKDIFNVFVVTKKYGPQFEKIAKLGIKNINIKDFFQKDVLINISPEFLKICFIIKQKKIDLIHINNNIIAGISAIIAAKIMKIPCICHLRQTRQLIKRELPFIKLVNKFIVINRYSLDLYAKFIPKDKLILVYDGLIPEDFIIKPSTLKEEFNINNNLTVGIVGRIVEGKGQKEFVLAAKEIYKIRDDIVFFIIGSPKGDNDSYYKEVLKLADNKIIFTGWREDINNILNGLDIVIQATSTFPEGFGLTIIEAMALEKPVIATNIPGPADLVVNGITGFLVPPSDVKSLSEAIINLIKNPEIANKMGENGRKRVKEEFDIRITTHKMEDIFLRELKNI